ncbi:MAG: hypothetical protein M3018_09325 [Actinomycetota bacterium]|nr:hypothetical protein [Actinomycetota bacterium]
MPTEPNPVTLAEVARRAVEACDDGSSEGLDDLLARLEDADVPLATIEDIEATLDEAVGPVDPDEDPPLAVARAIIVYLRYRRDEIDAEPADLLRLAVRAEFGDDPPEAVARWVDEQGMSR